jgi:hypothetical protein
MCSTSGCQLGTSPQWFKRVVARSEMAGVFCAPVMRCLDYNQSFPTATPVSDTTRRTFSPSPGIAMILLAIGKPLLALFGPGFEDGYPLILVLSIGLIARASVAPSERLLNTVGDSAVRSSMPAHSRPRALPRADSALWNLWRWLRGDCGRL